MLTPQTKKGIRCVCMLTVTRQQRSIRHRELYVRVSLWKVKMDITSNGHLSKGINLSDTVFNFMSCVMSLILTCNHG